MSRRPILWGLLAGLLLAAMLAPWTGAALGTLSKARTARAAALAALAEPVASGPIVRSDLAFAKASAVSTARARIERVARGGGVLVESVVPVSAPAPLVMVGIRVSGPEKAVLALADALERERPLMRFRAWRIASAEGGGVRLSGTLIGAVR